MACRRRHLYVRDIMTSVNNIVLPTGGSCPFCAFLQGEKPYTILRRSELVAAWPESSRSRAVAGFVRAAVEVAATHAEPTPALA